MEQIGLKFEVVVSDAKEKITSTAPGQVVEELATLKAESVWRMLAETGQERTEEKPLEELLVVGADTVVACDGKILGKPGSPERAKEMLGFLQGRAHQVYTGVCLLYGRGDEVERRCFYEATEVHFYPMSEAEIDTYVATGDPLDKAGAYGIQGFCARYIKGIEGDYNNVVGLPVGRLYQEIKEL